MKINIDKLFESIGVEQNRAKVNVMLLIQGGNTYHVEHSDPVFVRTMSPTDIRQAYINQHVKHEANDDFGGDFNSRESSSLSAEYGQRCGKISMVEPKFSKMDNAIEWQMRCDDAMVFFSTKEFDYRHWSHIVKHPKFRSMMHNA